MQDANFVFPIQYRFHWDEAKAHVNQRKHGVSFEQAKALLSDPLSISLHDDDHDGAEERWFTVGSADGPLLAMTHTYEDLDGDCARVRIISARRPTPDERRQYETGRYRIEEAVMKRSVDSSQWVRGRFYREGAVFIGPVHVEEDLVVRISLMANEQGVSPSAVANEMLRRAMAQTDTSSAPQTTKAQTPV
jgi:uncharacterized DUF497 family protein